MVVAILVDYQRISFNTRGLWPAMDHIAGSDHQKVAQDTEPTEANGQRPRPRKQVTFDGKCAGSADSFYHRTCCKNVRENYA